MITLLEIIERAADELALRANGTLTAGGTGSVTAAAYPFLTSRAGASNRRYEGNELYMTSGPAVPNPTSIAAYTAGTGVFDVSPDFTVPAVVGNTFDIFLRGTTYAMFKTAVNRALRNLRYLSQTALTYVPDGDMEDPTTDYWGPVNGGVVTKNPGYSPGGRGALQLQVQGGGTAYGGAQSNGFVTDPVNAGNWYIQVKVAAPVGSASIALYDVLTSTIVRREVWTSPAWGILEMDINVASELAAVRLEAVGPGDLARFDDAIAYPTGATELPMPSWFTDPAQLRAVYRTQTGSHRGDEPWPWEERSWDLVPDQGNPAQPWRLQAWSNPSGPVWIEAARPYPELSADSDTTLCDPEWIVLATQVEVLKALVANQPTQEVGGWKTVLYGDGPRNPGKLSALKMKNSRLMPPSAYLTVPA